MDCPKCGSEDIRKAGMQIRRGGRTQGYVCASCGHRFVPGGKK